MSRCIDWQGQAVAYLDGETVGSALWRSGVVRWAGRSGDQAHGVFCGIGQCQGCLVMVGERVVEACLLPCSEGLQVRACPPPKGGGA